MRFESAQLQFFVKKKEMRTSDDLTEELLALDIEKDGLPLRELVLLAEDFSFTSEQSERLAPRLLEIAIRYRDSNDPQDTPFVFSAIRTGASMLRPYETNRLLPLLESGHSIDTILVVLKMLRRIFEVQPPEGLDQYAELTSKVRGIVDSLLSPYSLIVSGRNAALAELSILALAAMGSSDTLDIMRSIRQLGVSWFSQQVKHELCELQGSWDAQLVEPELRLFLQRI